jgi:hypothetical protein
MVPQDWSEVSLADMSILNDMGCGHVRVNILAFEKAVHEIKTRFRVLKNYICIIEIDMCISSL